MSEIKAADVIAMMDRLRELPPQPIYMTEEEIVKMEQFADWLEGKGPMPTMDGDTEKEPTS